MTDKFDDQVPGVTFWFKNAEETRDDRRKGIRTVEIKLFAEISDEEMYKAVLKKLESGLRIYTAEDFTSSVLSLMRERIGELETELTMAQRNLRQAADDKTRVEAELKKYKEPFINLGRQLGYRGGSGS